MNIGDKVILKIPVDHLPLGAIVTICATDKIFQSIIPECYRKPGMMKVSSYGYEGNTSRATHYNTYVHESNVIKAEKCSKCSEKYKTIEGDCTKCNGTDIKELYRKVFKE